MKNILGLLLILFIALTSCEGRISKHQALVESVETFKNDTRITQENYFPETYHETLTDTIMNNGFSIKIKTFTDMENSILNVFEKDSIEHKHFYRKVEGLISIAYNNKVIFEEVITKEFITATVPSFKGQLDRSILQAVWINQADALGKNTVSLNIHYCAVHEDSCRVFNLTAKENGSYDLRPISLKEEIY